MAFKAFNRFAPFKAFGFILPPVRAI